MQSDLQQLFSVRVLDTTAGRPFELVKNGEVVDSYRRRIVASVVVRELNSGRAVVEPHRPVGTRVQPVSS